MRGPLYSPTFRQGAFSEGGIQDPAYAPQSGAARAFGPKVRFSATLGQEPAAELALP